MLEASLKQRAQRNFFLFIPFVLLALIFFYNLFYILTDILG